MTKTHHTKTHQYLLKFPPKIDFGDEDFMVTSCNQAAYQWIKIWPQWQHFALNIYGAPSSGKSHLAHIWVNTVLKTLPRPVQIPIMQAQNINMKNVNKIANENNYLVLENLDNNVNEEALFHLYNFFNTPNHFLLITSTIPLAKLSLKLPDLRSRLNTIPNIEIEQPDDEMLCALIAKLFNDKQIIITQEMLEYILSHAERSFSFIRQLIDEIDNISWTYNRAVSISIIKEALENLTKNQQLELFT